MCIWCGRRKQTIKPNLAQLSMIDFFQQLKFRNEALFYFGAVCLIASCIFLILAKTTQVQVFGVNAWNKPFKFAFSTVLFSWSMAWYCYYLPDFNISRFNISVVILLGFEIFYIAFQANRGQLSHYNLSTPVYATLYSLMALAASAVTVYTAYVGYLFFINDFPNLPSNYIWAIRFGIILFVIFAFEGFAMGARLNHSVGAMNNNSNWFIVGWSKTVGDLRIAHFIGMHALQVLPILAFYSRSNKVTWIVILLYSLLTIATFIQAVKGKSIAQTFAKSKQIPAND